MVRGRRDADCNMALLSTSPPNVLIRTLHSNFLDPDEGMRHDTGPPTLLTCLHIVLTLDHTFYPTNSRLATGAAVFQAAMYGSILLPPVLFPLRVPRRFKAGAWWRPSKAAARDTIGLQAPARSGQLL